MSLPTPPTAAFFLLRSGFFWEKMLRLFFQIMKSAQILVLRYKINRKSAQVIVLRSYKISKGAQFQVLSSGVILKSAQFGLDLVEI